MNRVNCRPGAAPGSGYGILMKKYDENEIAAYFGPPGDDRDGVRPGGDITDATRYRTAYRRGLDANGDGRTPGLEHPPRLLNPDTAIGAGEDDHLFTSLRGWVGPSNPLG
jgi:hypothetical protein